MAEIKPIRAWRYSPKLPCSIHSLISPLFDVVSESERAILYKNPYNSIHLSCPSENGVSPVENGQLLKKWKQENILVQDRLPGIYVYYQYFKLPGSEKINCRKGFVVYIRTYDWDDNVVLRHENTIPDAVCHQADLLANAQLHASATHGLYTDPDFVLEKWMDEAILSPIYNVESQQGIKNVLAVIHDKKVIDQFVAVIQNKKILLADGHHRYQGSIDYATQQKAINPNHRGDEGYNFHLIYLSNTASGGVRIFPTHRLIEWLNGFNRKELLHALGRFFYVSPIKDPVVLDKKIAQQRHTFGVLFRGASYVMQLKPEWHDKITWDIPNVLKQLDVTILHYFVLEKILKIPYEEQRFFKNIKFEHDLSKCMERVNNGKSDMAIIMQEISVEVVKKVSESGYIMPQKSTYFYPKLICGFLFGSVKEDEFQAFPYSGFR